MRHSIRRLHWVISATAVALVAGAATAASDVSNARILQVRTDDNGTGTISFDTFSGSGRPSCATFDSSSGRHLAVSLATIFGRETLKLAMAAQLAGKRVRYVGNNVCTVHSNKEDLGTLYVYE